MVQLSELMKGERWRESSASRPARQEPPPPPEPERRTAPAVPPEKLYRGLLQYMHEVEKQVTADLPFDFDKGVKIIRFIVDCTPETWEDLHMHTLLAGGEERESLALHAVHVAINALVIGGAQRLSPSRLVELGVAALFHETGMIRVPESIRQKTGRLTPEELEVIREHPFHTADIVGRYGELGEVIADIVLQEHERLDGSGYPRELKGEDIHEFAFVIGLLDIYQALVCYRPYRKQLSPADAMKELVKRSKGLFPHQLIKKVMSQLSIYPVKSFIQLNNGSIGMVVKANPLWPLKPVVSILFDAQGKRLTGEHKMVDLSRNPLLHVKDVIPMEDAEKLGV